MINLKKLTPEQAKDLCWKRGRFAFHYLRDDQLPIYELLNRSKNPFIECARRYGKTTTILCYVIEKLIQNPKWVCMWAEPFKFQARDIVIPEILKLCDLAPAVIRPRYQVTDSVFVFPNGSRLKLRGVNEDRGDSARGSFAHIIVADEFGTWKDPDYIVNSALRPQLQTTNGHFIFASTPAEDLAHAYYTHKKWALAQNRFIQRIVTDNRTLTDERLLEMKKEVGGEDTVAWQREYLCREISDPGRLVIPEFKPEVHIVEDDYPRPAFYDAYVGMDLGFNDCTAALFGYWDFLKCELVIEDELLVTGKNSREITEAAKSIEKRLWESKKPYLRVSDNDLQQIYDMLTICDYSVLPTRKDDKLAAINALRLRFTSHNIKIKRRCQNLLYQLKVGLWNERRTDFQRGEHTGHLDAVAALIYLHRSLVPTHNPYPTPEELAQWDKHWVNPHAPKNVQTERDALTQAFRPFGKN